MQDCSNPRGPRRARRPPDRRPVLPVIRPVRALAKRRR
ncbi:hypothetical protein BURCENBC7_AP5667 [Burkholderia cenocepacia BC7]|nr:uncharacterized protein BCN122_I2851 [Burkholderia cenocepacia]EPZ85659.1 hypothetical protein BURCENK562V_C5857 [Burkholderia cenocepacia K56-2Valvano]ERI30329.1 hypothetical protein BURCENBC7_AP5667 [Burkholderia cenocepacia BC7]